MVSVFYTPSRDIAVYAGIWAVGRNIHNLWPTKGKFARRLTLFVTSPHLLGFSKCETLNILNQIGSNVDMELISFPFQSIVDNRCKTFSIISSYEI